MIYLDSSATSIPDPELWDYFKALFSDDVWLANPSSVHAYGKKSKLLIRNTINLIQTYLSTSYQIIFTSCATEGIALLVNSLPDRSHVVTTSIEHPSIIENLKKSSLNVTYIDPNPQDCVVDIDNIISSVSSDTVAIILGWVNSETGIKADIDRLAQFTKSNNIALIIDATALIGKEQSEIPDGVTALVFSGHKIHTVSGIGVIALHKQFHIKPMFFGGGQQFELRPGTENIIGIASLHYIFAKLLDNQSFYTEYLLNLRNQFEKQLILALPDLMIHGSNLSRVSNISTIAFPSLEGEVLQIALDMAGVACSYGTACSSGATTAFKSLVGIDPEIARATVRFSFSRFNSEDEIAKAVHIIKDTVVNMKRSLFN